MLTSQGLVVPAGTVAHSRPSTTAAGVLADHHQGAVPSSNPPLATCSAGAADAATGVVSTSVIASRALSVLRDIRFLSARGAGTSVEGERRGGRVGPVVRAV